MCIRDSCRWLSLPRDLAPGFALRRIRRRTVWPWRGSVYRTAFERRGDNRALLLVVALKRALGRARPLGPPDVAHGILILHQVAQARHHKAPGAHVLRFLLEPCLLYTSPSPRD